MKLIYLTVLSLILSITLARIEEFDGVSYSQQSTSQCTVTIARNFFNEGSIIELVSVATDENHEQILNGETYNSIIEPIVEEMKWNIIIKVINSSVNEKMVPFNFLIIFFD